VKQDTIRHFDFYCFHHLKNDKHIDQFKDWYETIGFPEATWFVKNLKYISGNTYDHNAKVIHDYLLTNELYGYDDSDDEVLDE